MHRFWPIVEPILTPLRPRSIIEIGADGATTADLLRYANEHQAVVHVIGVAPAFDLDDLAAHGGGNLVHHPGPSVETLPEVAREADVVVIDVDREQERLDGVLALLDALARPAPGGFPLCLLHGDMRNGVRPAVESFLRITSRELAFASMPNCDELSVLSERGVVDAVTGEGLEWRGGAGAVAESDGRIAVLEASAAQRDDYIEALEAALLEQAEQLSATWGSRYWRFTAPVRRMVEASRAARRRLHGRGRGHSHAVAVPLASLDSPEVRMVESQGGEIRWSRPPEIGMRTSWRLEQRLPARVAYRVAVPPNSAFSSEVTVRARAWGSSHSAVRVRVRLLDADGAQLAATATEIDPRRVKGKGGWNRLHASLGPGGDDCTLVLEAEPVGAAAPRVMIAWRDPYLSVPAPRGGEPVSPAATARGMRRRLVGHASDPAISVLMPVHDPPPEFLERAIESVREQTYARWQLCIVDDGSSDRGVVELLGSQAAADERILLRRHERAGGISSATNAALRMATGEFVALVDHDDELEPDALESVVAHLREHPETDIVYTDEDRILANGKRLGAVLKPDWSPELLRAGMYTCHLGVYRRRLVEEVGGFRSEFDGSQDFDLMLRLVEATQRIGHVPRVLYHWRASDASVAINPMAKPYAYDAGRRAVQSHLERTGVAGEAHRSGLPGLYRVTHRVDPTTPVSIILAADRADEHTLAGVRRCAQAIAERTAHPSWELLWVCPESLAETAAGVTLAAGDDRVRCVVPPGSAARSAMIEHAVRAATGEHVVLFDAPCEPLVEEWLGVLLGFSVQEGVAAVGAKVLSPNGSIEHGGVVIGGGLPLPAYRGVRSDYVGYLGTLAVPSNYSAVAGIVMTRRELFLRLGGLRRLPPLLAEADYCLRARLRGLRTVFAPDAALALVDPSAARPAPVADLAAFKQTWLDTVPRDPYYHPQFWQQRASFPGPSPVRGPAGAPRRLAKEASALPGVS